MTAPVTDLDAPDAPMNLAKPLELDEGELRHLREEALASIYGADFPLIDDMDPDNADWGRWLQNLWDRQDGAVRQRLLLSERNRLFYTGSQWISQGPRGWQTPPKPRDAARPVANMVRAAVDYRVTVITEQRPGFRTKPAKLYDPSSAKQAQAQQAALEYAFEESAMPAIKREAAHWAQLDGVSFLEGYWDPDAGPWHEAGDGRRFPLGDGRWKVWRIEQVRVSPGATATVRPFWWLLHDEIPRAQAVREYGLLAVDPHHGSLGTDAGGRASGWADVQMSTVSTRQLEQMLENEEKVKRFKLYCEPSEYLPNGLTVVVVDNQAVFVGDLLFGIAPMVRVTDGSADPSFYPIPIMDDWLDHQVRVNAILARWVETLRKMSGGRIITRGANLVQETLVGGLLSAIEVRGPGPLNESVQVMNTPGLSQDAKELLLFEIQQFEQKSGWNDAARGSFDASQSGRAILAQSEILQRVFTPPVTALAGAMTEWAKVQLHMMRWGYDIPRAIAAVGSSRPDLGLLISRDDFDGVCDVHVEPSTMMPMPHSLRMFLLDEALAKGAIDLQAYRREQPFALLKNLQTPDDDQTARAHRVVEAIKMGMPLPPILWQDNEAIHQDVLERELILPDDQDPMWRQVALQRWSMLAQQAAFKAQMTGMMPGAASMMPMPAGGGAGGPALPPRAQALLGGGNPAVPSASAARMVGETDEQRAGLSFDQRNPI